jgi:restriction system protein
MQFEPFRQFVAELKERATAATKKTGALPPVAPESAADDQTTPEERIESAFAELRETLITDLRARLANVDPFRFEQVVLDLLVAMGYGGSRKEAAAVTQKTGDEGIDGVINEDRLGLDVIYIQAKRWKANVGRPEIQSFVGALAGKKANKGIFITTSAFHDNASDYAEGLQHKVILIDGRRLAELMIEHGIGVAEEHAYSVKKIDSDYFDEA